MWMHSVMSVFCLVSVLIRYRFSLFLFFFFQAEDGIRDHCVTGVQTCALPIFDILLMLKAPKMAIHSQWFDQLLAKYTQPSLGLYEIGRASCRERV